MFAESIHSVADTVNQIILAFGLHKSAKVSITLYMQIEFQLENETRPCSFYYRSARLLSDSMKDSKKLRMAR